MTQTAIRIHIDADACPVKDEIYDVAARHGVPVTAVAGALIRVPLDPMIERVAAGNRMDAADNWIVERAGPTSIVVTFDIPPPQSTSPISRVIAEDSELERNNAVAAIALSFTASAVDLGSTSCFPCDTWPCAGIAHGKLSNSVRVVSGR